MAKKTRKTASGRFFEDFHVGQELRHQGSRTITSGDVSLYIALTGGAFALQSSDPFARSVGYHAAPVDDLLVFHIVFGLSVADISKNATANLGYAGCDFLSQIMVGETISARSTVTGLREVSSGQAGIVYVRTEGLNQRGQPILTYSRWVMVPKRYPESPAPDPIVPDLPDQVAPLTVPRHRINRAWDDRETGSPHRWEDYEPGERIDHIDGVTVEEAEHMMAARLYDNSARAHLDQRAMADSAFGRRLVYGGHVISMARALSRNGLANGCILSAINGGKHRNPVFGGDTIYAWTEVLERIVLDGRTDIGALRLMTRAVKNRPAGDFPCDGQDLVLELDYTVIMPRR